MLPCKPATLSPKNFSTPASFSPNVAPSDWTSSNGRALPKTLEISSSDNPGRLGAIGSTSGRFLGAYLSALKLKSVGLKDGASIGPDTPEPASGKFKKS